MSSKKTDKQRGADKHSSADKPKARSDELAARADALQALVEGGVYGEALQRSYGEPEEGFAEHQRRLLAYALQTQNRGLVGATLFLAPLVAPASDLLPLFYQLLEVDWHDSHETIADELGRDLAAEENIPALTAGALRSLPDKFYDAPIFSLGTRCVWGLGNIGSVESVRRLGELLERGNGVVRRQARGQLERLAKEATAPEVKELAASTWAQHREAIEQAPINVRSLVRRVDVLADYVFWDGPAGPEELGQLEKTIGVALPTAYREFLALTGGGGGPSLEWLNAQGCQVKTIEWRSQGLIDASAVALFEFRGVRWFIADDGSVRCHGKGAGWIAADGFVALLRQYVHLLTEPLGFEITVDRTRDPSPKWRRVMRSLDVQELSLIEERVSREHTALHLKATSQGQFAASALVAVAALVIELRDAGARVAIVCPWSAWVPVCGADEL